MSSDSARRIIPIVALSTTEDALAPAELVPLFEAQKTIHPRTVTGWFTRWRWAFVWLTQAVFYGVPWLDWAGRQAVLFDLETRRFYVLGLVLYPQDFIYLAGLLVVSALSLFLFTAVAGRLWCGYACPQTVYTEMFLWIERKIEGDRGARIRLDGARMSTEKLVKKWFKHVVWISVALWTGFTFVGYFTPIRDLALAFLQTHMTGWEVFWVLFYGLATYGNAGFMREQVCKYMCPYARFQSAMFDRDTLVVGYDSARGEPRGGRSAHADVLKLNLGACVDCTLCVQVCPTGIDIRDGLQYECIGCGACADACDGMMDKMGYARGLVRYTTQQSLAEGLDRAQMWRRLLRPRVLVYTAVLAAISIALATSLALRTPFKVDVVRDRGSLARVVGEGSVENVYRLQIMNATEATQRFHIEATGLPGLKLVTEAETTVAPTQSRWVAVRLQLPYGSGTAPGSHAIAFHVQAPDAQAAVQEKSVFIVPR